MVSNIIYSLVQIEVGGRDKVETTAIAIVDIFHLIVIIVIVILIRWVLLIFCRSFLVIFMNEQEVLLLLLYILLVVDIIVILFIIREAYTIINIGSSSFSIIRYVKIINTTILIIIIETILIDDRIYITIWWFIN